jgi:mycothiol S-conjugate amidase
MTDSHPSLDLCLLAVYAHPDDEVFAFGGTLALLAKRGVRVVLAVATGGEEGEVVNPDLRGRVDLTELPAIRSREQVCAQAALGITEIVLMNYRDSGMADSEANRNPAAFVNVPSDEVVGAIVGLIREHRPQVVITFDETGGYGHPDHITAQGATRRAFQLAGDPDVYPDRGKPWMPLKLYYPVFAQRMIREVREAYRARGLPFRFGSGLDEVDAAVTEESLPGFPDDVITTIVDVSSTIDNKLDAFRCYATQMPPDFFYLTAPTDVVHGPLSREYAILVETRVETRIPEHDPFEGVPGSG